MPSRYTFPEAPTLDAQDDVLTVRLLPPEDLITYLAIALQNTSDGDDVDRIASSLVRKYDETHTGIWNRWIGVYAQDSGRLIGGMRADRMGGDLSDETCEISSFVGRRYRGKGIAARAKGLLIPWLMHDDNWPLYRRVESVISRSNESALRAIAKTSMCEVASNEHSIVFGVGDYTHQTPDDILKRHMSVRLF